MTSPYDSSSSRVSKQVIRMPQLASKTEVSGMVASITTNHSRLAELEKTNV